ncbi:L,D-transpeptidase family protein [Rhodanobacter sp. L36]|uniref:L,D-transpeptidase family protein n=1 Tax=Rhodanobacter sp. L36 TaxID=1747221 RepID=UPI00131DA4AE|nr:L,D-transpeptidase family protein [Rhodanobacter sp. L36]
MSLPRFHPSRIASAVASVVLCAAFSGGDLHANETGAWQSSRQLVLVTVAGWNTNHGTLRTFSLGPHGWIPAGIDAPVTIGKNGAGWGLGLNTPRSDGPVKHEGDNRSPAGVFRIGTIFGYADKADTAMPYRALTATDYCVDVSGAAQYNRVVDAKVVGDAAVKGSTEPMRRDIHANGDQRYRLGFNIEQNPEAKPLAGSCIFGHLWKSPTDATAGCTAMTPTTMQSLVAWLKPRDKPVFVLLPQNAYLKLRAQWKLPTIAKDSTR